MRVFRRLNELTNASFLQLTGGVLLQSRNFSSEHIVGIVIFL